MFKNLRLSTKIAAGYAVIILFMIILGGTGFFALRERHE